MKLNMFSRSLLAIVATGALAFSPLTASATEVLKVGVLGPLTGGGASWGLGIDGGVRIAAQKINERGGLAIGDKKYKIEVISYDDQYKAAAAVTAINRLIGPDGVRYVFGPIGSASLLAIKPITERAKVQLFTAAWSVDVLKDSKYVFRVGPTTQEFAPSTIEWLKQNRPAVKRVAAIAANDETGWNSQRIQKEFYEKAGYDVVSAVYFERSQTDFRALLTQVLANNPDSIELDTVPPATAGLIVRQAREQGFEGIFTKFGAFDVDEIVRAAGKESSEGMIGIMQADPNTETWASLKADFAKLHKNDMGDYVVLYYDMANLVFSAMERAGTVEDSDAVVAALEVSAPFKGSVGTLTWGGMEAYGSDHQIYRSVVVVEIVDGAGKVVGEATLN